MLPNEVPVDPIPIETGATPSSHDGVRIVELPFRNIVPPPLPIAPTTLIGREREIEEISTLLTTGGVRLLTLVGPGGIGKSRLALALGQEFAEQQALPVAFISLASLRDPMRLLGTIAAGCGIPDMPPDPTVTQFANALGTRPLLLVLDNLEQLVAAAPILTELLARCPGLRLLCTSRRRLRLSGERVVAVRGLTVPGENNREPESVARAAAVRLFVERATAMTPEMSWSPDQLQAVGDICRLVEGEPLAIELAAARAPLLPPVALLERMGRVLPALGTGPSDAEPRQRTMRATLQWSYELLSPEAQRVFRQASVFVGGCTLASAEAILSDTGAELLDILSQLVDFSLLRTTQDMDGTVRFLMSPPVWEFAAERHLGDNDVRAVRDRHARYFHRWLQSDDFYRYTLVHETFLRGYSPGWPNVRAAFEWLIESAQGYRALELVWSAAGLGWLRLHGAELRSWMERAHALTASDQVTPLRVRITSWIGLMASIHAEDEKALPFAQDAIGLARDLDDGALLGLILRHGGQVARNAGLFDQALAWHAAALRIPDVQADAAQRATTHYEYGASLLTAGRLSEARTHIETSFELVGQLPRSHVSALAELALVRLDLVDGKMDSARSHLDHLFTNWLDQDDLSIVAETLLRVAALCEVVGSDSDGARLLGAAVTMRDMTARRRFRDEPLFHMLAGQFSGRLGPGRYASAYAEGTALSRDEALEFAQRLAHGDADSAPAPDEAAMLATLSPRERAVLALLTAGRTDREIADALFISRSTVSRHVESILRKLQVSSRTAAAVVATRATPPPAST